MEKDGPLDDRKTAKIIETAKYCKSHQKNVFITLENKGIGNQE
jgi:hypothetical protein